MKDEGGGNREKVVAILDGGLSYGRHVKRTNRFYRYWSNGKEHGGPFVGRGLSGFGLQSDEIESG